MKLVKKVIVNAIGAERVHWMIQDKLKGIVDGGWLVKDGNYWYGFDGKGVQIPLKYNQKKKSELIEAIKEYSEAYDEKLVELEKEKENQYVRAYAFGDYKLVEYKNNVSEFYDVDSVIDVDFFCRNKQNSLGVYFEEVYIYPEQIKKMKACVEMVIEIEPSEYDEYIEDFWSGEVAEKVNAELKGRGGSGSCTGHDDVVFVVAIMAKGKKTLLVNPEGFDYPRYIAMAI